LSSVQGELGGGRRDGDGFSVHAAPLLEMIAWRHPQALIGRRVVDRLEQLTAASNDRG
jgi:hypothetical protein